ncbi:hypothetical protein BD410DRAFT_606511 [Rickenella mellea]|uniref:Uncharacterized protein n=1 Tax=Rickenella mellea TaxID=50990 RepID=A0A4Y7QFU8_9AGAM|nr:hypothetical protein BD410DRAFT_606511 [Rickenella mellea]
MSVSTGLVLTTGGIDVTCPGRQSFPGSSTATSTSMSSTSYSSLSPSPSGTSLPNTGPVKMTRNSNAAVIAGGVAGGITLLLAAFLAVGCLRKKPRAHVSQKVDLEGPSGETGSLLYPTSYASGQSVDRDARSSTRGNSEGFFNGRGRAALNIEVTSPALIHSPPLTNPYGSTSFDSDTASDQGLVYNADRPFSPQYRDEGSSRSRLLVANTDRDPSSSSRASSAYRKTEPPQQEEVIVLRHRDAGPALEELPPAYGEQSNGNR